MKWYDKLYIGDSIAKKADRIKWKINHNAGTIGVYVIAFASNPVNLLDIIPAYQLMQKSYPKKDMRIIGLAGDYYEALELVSNIVDEVYQATGDVKVRQYLELNRRNAV